ncbi:Vacuolar membrane protease [Bienertia sinuspersici]
MSAYSCRLDVGHEIHHLLSRSRAFTSRSNRTVRDSLVNRLPQGMAFRV